MDGTKCEWENSCEQKYTPNKGSLFFTPDISDSIKVWIEFVSPLDEEIVPIILLSIWPSLESAFAELISTFPNPTDFIPFDVYGALVNDLAPDLSVGLDDQLRAIRIIISGRSTS